MTHLAIFMMILSLPLGLAAAIRTIQFYRRYKYRYLLAFGIFLCGINMAVFLSLAKNYIFTNILQRFVSLSAVVVESFYRTILIGAQLVAFFILIYMLAQLLQVELRPAVKRLYAGAALLMFVVVAGITVWSLKIVDAIPVLIANIVFGFCMDGAWLAIIVMYFIRIKILQEKNKRKALIIFGFFYMVPNILLDVLTFFHIYGNVSNDTLLVSSSIFLYIVYTGTLLFTKRFMELYHGKIEMANHHHRRLEDLFKKYNISKREQEIIMLICEGKSNKEIEDKLFISMHTVKDHVYKIYQKTGVKNRVQLSRLFTLH